MSIADKLIIIADNTPSVAEVMNNALVNGQVSNAIVIDGVLSASPIECHVEAENLDDASVIVCGRNMLTIASVDAEADTSKVVFSGSVTGDFVFSCLYNYTECKTPTAAQFEFTVDGATQYMARGTTDSAFKKISGTLTKIRFLNWGYGVGTVDNMQLEAGNSASPYEAYKNAQIGVPDESGKIEGLVSVAPTTTIYSKNGTTTFKFYNDNALYEQYKQLLQAEKDLRDSI